MTTASRVITPAGPGTTIVNSVAICHGKVAVRLDRAVHESGRLVEYFDPVDVTPSFTLSLWKINNERKEVKL